MALELSIKSDIKELEKDLRLLGRAGPNIIAQTINRAASGARTSMVRQSQELLNLRNQRRLRRDSFIQKANPVTLSAAVGYRNTRKPNARSTRRFSKTKRHGVRFTSFGKRVHVPSGFVVKNRTAFVREGRRRLPIRPIVTQLNAAQALHKDPSPVHQSFLERFDKELRRRIDFELKKRGFR